MSHILVCLTRQDSSDLLRPDLVEACGQGGQLAVKEAVREGGRRRRGEKGREEGDKGQGRREAEKASEVLHLAKAKPSAATPSLDVQGLEAETKRQEGAERRSDLILRAVRSQRVSAWPDSVWVWEGRCVDISEEWNPDRKPSE